jgi:hypothetical protein
MRPEYDKDKGKAAVSTVVNRLVRYSVENFFTSEDPTTSFKRRALLQGVTC